MEFLKGNSIYGKTMEFEQNGRTYGKTMEFSFWWKMCVLSLKKCGKCGNRVLMFVASVIISLGLALRTSRTIPLVYCSAE